jgi:hypothetical protein
VAIAAVVAGFVPPMAVHAPSHIEGRFAEQHIPGRYRSMANRTCVAFGSMDAMTEENVTRNLIDSIPGNSRIFCGYLRELSDMG